MLAALAWWGFRTGGAATRWALALGAPLAAAVVWALFISPRASLGVTDPLRLVLEPAVFGAGAAALAGVARPRLALVFGAVVAAHVALTFALAQRG